MQRLPPSKVVEAGPRGYRPAIIKLPIKRPADTLHIAPPVLYAVANALSLKQHTQVDQHLKVLGHSENVGHLGNHNTVAIGAALMMLHDI